MLFLLRGGWPAYQGGHIGRRQVTPVPAEPAINKRLQICFKLAAKARRRWP